MNSTTLIFLFSYASLCFRKQQTALLKNEWSEDSRVSPIFGSEQIFILHIKLNLNPQATKI